MKILLEGPILTQSGYGEHTRLVYKSLKLNDKNKVYVNPLRWGNTTWSLEESPVNKNIEKDIRALGDISLKAQRENSDTKFDLHVHVGIINEFVPKAPKSICITAGIETDRVSDDWLLRTYQNRPSKIIVPSSHAANGFLNSRHVVLDPKTGIQHEIGYNVDCPMEIIPYPVKKVSPEDIDIDLETDFNFLSIALSGPRKNLEDLVRCFLEEFKDESVGLVLKTAGANGSTIDRYSTIERLAKLIGKDKNRKCKIYLLHGDLSENQIHSLYQRDDIHAYVTATRGEGYGLPIFEAAYSGMPVVATDWSGHLDFLQAPFKEGGKVKIKKLFAKVNYKLEKIHPSAVWEKILIADSKWAQVDESSLKRQMRNVKKTYGRYKAWAKTLQKYILENYEEDKILNKLEEALVGKSLKSTDSAYQRLQERKEKMKISGAL